MAELNNRLYSKLQNNGFKIVGRYISKRSNTDNKFKVVGQINENNLFFYSENVFPFTGGINFFDDNDCKQDFKEYYTKVKEKQRNDFNVSFKNYIETTKKQSTFNAFLNNTIDKELSKEAINYFDVRGVLNGYLEDATCFPFFDIDNNFITAQIIKYGVNGKRIKSNFSTNWYHSYKPIKKELGLKDTDSYSVSVPCFFGENYLKDSDNIVAIVEAPKTAVILKELYPNIDWIATAGEQALFNKNLDVLKDKKVVLFPDAHTTKWKEFAELKGFYCSDILDKKDITVGSDIADHIFNNESFIFSQLHELLYCLNVGEFNFDINADAIKLDFKVNDYKTNYFTAIPQYYKGHKVLNQLDNSNEFDIVFKGNKFDIYSDKYELYSAQIDWHRPKINKEKEVVKIDEKDFISKLQGVFRILKSLNPKIYKGVFKCVLLRLRESNFSFNESYVLNRLVPLWDSYNQNLDSYKIKRNWKYKGVDSLKRKEFIQELNNHRFQYKLKMRLEYFNDVLIQNRFIDLETDLDISKFTKGLTKIKDLVKKWNTDVIGCKTIKTYFKKIEFNNKINACTKKLPLYNKGLIYGGNNFVQSNISVTDAINLTGIKNRKTVKDFLTFEPDATIKKEIFDTVFYLLNNINDVIPTRETIGDKIRITTFETIERKPIYESLNAFDNVSTLDSVKDFKEYYTKVKDETFAGLDILTNTDTSGLTEIQKQIYTYEVDYLKFLDSFENNKLFYQEKKETNKTELLEFKTHLENSKNPFIFNLENSKNPYFADLVF